MWEITNQDYSTWERSWLKPMFDTWEEWAKDTVDGLYGGYNSGTIKGSKKFVGAASLGWTQLVEIYTFNSPGENEIFGYSLDYLLIW